MSAKPRTVFIVSDGTGITAETFSHSILAQFEVTFKQIRLPFIDSIDKAYQAAREIEDCAKQSGQAPIVFTTLVNPEINSVIKSTNALIMDMFHTFVAPLEKALNAVELTTKKKIGIKSDGSNANAGRQICFILRIDR